MRLNRAARSRKALRTKKSKDFESKIFSFTFLLSIFGNFLIGAICVLTGFVFYENYPVHKELWSVFGMGFLGSLIIIGTSKFPRFRTLIHELKHLVLVVLSGNRVTDFHVDTHSGHVEYKMYSDRSHFGPIITLAPYFFPLFSLPVLIGCLIFEGHYQLFLGFALGFSLAADISFGFTDMHPHQSDLRRIVGGFFTAGAYLAGAHLMWTAFTSLWVFGGRTAYLHAGYLTIDLVTQIARYLMSH